MMLPNDRHRFPGVVETTNQPLVHRCFNNDGNNLKRYLLIFFFLNQFPLKTMVPHDTLGPIIHPSSAVSAVH